MVLTAADRRRWPGGGPYRHGVTRTCAQHAYVAKRLQMRLCRGGCNCGMAFGAAAASATGAAGCGSSRGLLAEVSVQAVARLPGASRCGRRWVRPLSGRACPHSSCTRCEAGVSDSAAASVHAAVRMCVYACFGSSAVLDLWLVSSTAAGIMDSSYGAATREASA